MSTIGPADATLELPASHAARFVVVQLATTNFLYGAAAALGLCWRGVGRLHARGFERDPAAYGEAVFDELVGRGHQQSEILDAAVKAYKMVAESMVTEAELREALGNSEAPAEDSNG